MNFPNRIFNFIRVGSLLLLSTFSLSAAAEDLLFDTDKARLISERPNAGGPPVVIKLEAYLLDLDFIDDARQRFSVDMFLRVDWKDERLALQNKTDKELIRQVPLDNIWHPKGIIMNGRGLAPALPRTANIDSAGNVRFAQRITGELTVNLQFRPFPFDTQMLPIDLVSYTTSTDEVEFAADSVMFESEKPYSIEGWELTVMPPKIGEYKVPGRLKPQPRIVFLIDAERDSSYYMLTLFIPMTFIILMAWSVFWLPPDIIPARVGLSTASIFSFVALGFSVRSRLPEVSYMTQADYFVTGCTLLVFLALGAVVWGSRLANTDRLDSALRISSVARWLYLLLFCGVVILSYSG